MNEEIVQPQEQIQEIAQEAPQPRGDREPNLRIMRERAEQAERRAYELEQQIARNQPQQEDDTFTFGEDDGLLENKHLKKYDKKKSKETETLQKEIARLETMINEHALKSRYKDFEDVVTEENLEKLSKIKPALFRSMMANPNIADRGDAAHELISSYVKPKFQAEEKKVAENQSKPRAASTVAPAASRSPIAAYDPNVRIRMTAEEKKDVQRDAALMKQRGYSR